MPGPRRRPPDQPTEPAASSSSSSSDEGPQGRAPDAFRGWADIRNSLNRHLPTQLAQSQRGRAAVLQILRAKSKVRR